MLTIQEALKRLNEEETPRTFTPKPVLSEEEVKKIQDELNSPKMKEAEEIDKEFRQKFRECHFSSSDVERNYPDFYKKWKAAEDAINRFRDLRKQLLENERKVQWNKAKQLSEERPEELKNRFFEFCKENELDKQGKVEVYRDKDGAICYTVKIENKAEGNDLFDIVDVEPNEWEDWDEEGGHEGGVDASFSEDDVEEHFYDKNEIYEDAFGDKEFILADTDADIDNNIYVDSYYSDPGDYWNPPEGEFELGGSITVTHTYYFEPNPDFKEE